MMVCVTLYAGYFLGMSLKAMLFLVGLNISKSYGGVIGRCNDFVLI